MVRLHFENLLSKNDEVDNYVPSVLEEHEHIDPPDEDAVIAAIENLKNNKACLLYTSRCV